MDVKTLMLVGTGALAGEVAGALAAWPGPPLRLAIVGRDERKAAALAFLTEASAAAAQRDVRASAHLAADGTAAQFAELVESVRPAGIVVCASLQSPWEHRFSPSAWTALLAAAGFGASLPFQAALAFRMQLALRECDASAWIVNACFPDAVNPLLAALGMPVLCGIGNIATIAESLRAGLDVAHRARLRLLAHHWHLGSVPEAQDAVAYLGEDRLTDVTARLAGQRAADRVALLRPAGLAAARLLTGLLQGDELTMNLPGPLGLPGGYPVRISPAGARLDLPEAVPLSEAVTLNRSWAVRDGVLVEDGRVAFADRTASALRPWLPDGAQGFRVADYEAVLERFGGLRDRLRRQ